ncbi:MAG: mannose-1-phosphate guanylyltransferase [Candidatus Omnitrophica bacterium]|nr:mannose-1-phosphate guanylyltransferase [Candidatus Omnitrophota bacterium]
MPKNTNLFAVILAGGSGTRFWPVSRKSRPKQFLNIVGKRTLLQETLARIQPAISAARIFIITDVTYGNIVKQQTARFKIPKDNVLLEPEGKNTAPAVCWAAAIIQHIDPGAVLAVLPSDHLIFGRKRFLKVLREAVGLAQRNYLVTLGIHPTRPETGYGYLKTAKKNIGGKQIMMVERFTEKPSLLKAKQFLRTKKYFWNSGMFVFRSSVILKEFQKYLPGVYRAVGRKAGMAHIRRVWKRLPKISVDYGILEKSKNVAAVPARGIGWSDLGSWESLTEILPKDQRGNILKGDIIAVDCRDTLVWTGRKLIAAVGLEGMAVIDTPDALLVCPKERSQDVREVVNVLTKKNRRER